jgi:hypothetical protein
MPFYSIEYGGRNLNISITESEVQSKRLKNHILRYFDNITYDNLTLFVEGLNETMYELDENEVVDYDTPVVLKIITN